MPGPLRALLEVAISVMIFTILASVVISWLRSFRVNISPYHPLVRAVEETAELVLRPIRRAVPTGAGGLDFSPVVAIILLSILRSIIGRL